MGKLRSGHLLEELSPYLMISALSFAVYFKCLFYGITKIDDDILIAANLPFLQKFSNILQVFTTDAFYQVKSIDLYRPLQSLSFIIDMHLGLNPTFAVHMTNILLHQLTCIVFYKLLLLLEFRPLVALTGALIYSVHYLFVSTVAWIPARGDLLLALFTCLTVITFIRFIDCACWRTCGAHLLCFSLALFSKETAVLIPLLLMVYVWAFKKKDVIQIRNLILPVCYAAQSLIYFVIKAVSVSPLKGVTGIIPFFKNIRTFPETVAKFFIPINISTLPAYKLSSTVTGLLIIAGLLLIHICLWKKLDCRPFFYFSWFVLFIIPGMVYYPSFYQFCYEHVEHRTYLVCCGLLMLMLNLLQLFELDKTRYFSICIAVLICYLTVPNLLLSENYRNPTNFSLRAIRTNPDSALAYSTYGAELYMLGRLEESLDNFNRALSIYDRYLHALHYRARVYVQRGLLQEALADLDTLIATDPSYDANDYYLRAQVKVVLSDYAGAGSDYAAVLRLDPGHCGANKGLQELQKRVTVKRPML